MSNRSSPILENGRTFYISILMGYYVALSWIYINEISVFWRYMGFRGEFDQNSLIISTVAVFLISIVSPINNDTRSILISSINFLFFVPSIIYVSYSYGSIYHYIAIIILFLSLISLSSFEMKFRLDVRVSNDFILYSVIILLTCVIAAYISYDGLRNFSLDIERVYEFRREDASELPGIFAYIYSNVTGALVPIGIIISQKQGKIHFTLAIIFLTIILFGMTHHKSVLFAPIGILIFYHVLNRESGINVLILSLFSMAMIFLIEIFYNRMILSSYESSYISSLIGRRLIFMPSMLDGMYIDFFETHAKYYWSSSRIVSWAIDEPYRFNAPYIIGYEYFRNLDTSANTGVIGSGFANAGLVGVSIYSIISGLMLSFLNSYGKVLGHYFVSSVGIVIFFTIISSTDLVTSVLSHGLLLLIVFLAVLPRDVRDVAERKGFV